MHEHSENKTRAFVFPCSETIITGSLSPIFKESQHKHSAGLIPPPIPAPVRTLSIGSTASRRADGRAVLGLTFSDPSLSLESGILFIYFFSLRCQAREQIDERSFPAADDSNLLPLSFTNIFVGFSFYYYYIFFIFPQMSFLVSAWIYTRETVNEGSFSKQCCLRHIWNSFPGDITPLTSAGMDLGLENHGQQNCKTTSCRLFVSYSKMMKWWHFNSRY